MYILAGDHRVTITKHVVNRYDNKRGLVLTIETTKENISLAELDAICDEIMANKLDIFVYNDADELQTTLRGFWHNCLVTKNMSGLLVAEITNESENTYQIGILQSRSGALEETSMLQSQQINAHTTSLTQHTQAIANHDMQVNGLVESATMQSATLDNLLLEVFPVIISTAIDNALAQVLANNSNTTENPTVNDTEEPVEETVVGE